MDCLKCIFYGHLMNDTIFNKNGEMSRKLGGIANNWWAFNEIAKSSDSHLDNVPICDVYPYYIGEALILESGSERFMKSCVNMKKMYQGIVECKWAHLSYINYLELTPISLKSVLEKSQFSSVDLCKADDINVSSNWVNMLKDIDIIFISSDEFDDYVLRSKIEVDSDRRPQYIVSHNKMGSSILYLQNNERVDISLNELKIKHVTDVDVCGCGDFFASSVIYYLVNDCIGNIPLTRLIEAVKFGHKKVEWILQNKKNKCKDSF